MQSYAARRNACDDGDLHMHQSDGPRQPIDLRAAERAVVRARAAVSEIQRPLPDGTLVIVAHGGKQDGVFA
jgi:broad specificity phosphatase PhoE